PQDASWVDHAHLGDVTLLRNIAGVRGGAFQQLFWNRSVKQLVLMPGAPEIDPFRADRAHVADDGSLLLGSRPLTGALLVGERAVSVKAGVPLFVPGTGCPELKPLTPVTNVVPGQAA